jgi:hypothetical protein
VGASNGIEETVVVEGSEGVARVLEATAETMQAQ